MLTFIVSVFMPQTRLLKWSGSYRGRPGFPYQAHPPPAAKCRGSFCDVGERADCSSQQRNSLSECNVVGGWIRCSSVISISCLTSDLVLIFLLVRNAILVRIEQSSSTHLPLTDIDYHVRRTHHITWPPTQSQRLCESLSAATMQAYNTRMP